MPYTWDECKFCRAQPGQECRFSEEQIVQRGTVTINKRQFEGLNYVDVEKAIRPMVKELVRQERIRQEKPVVENVSTASWFIFGVTVGGVAWLVLKLCEHFF